MENTPGNVGAALHGPLRQARAGAYLSTRGGWAPAAAAQGAPGASGSNPAEAGTFFGQAGAGQQQGQAWDTLLSQPPAAPPNPFAAWASAGEPTGTQG